MYFDNSINKEQTEKLRKIAKILRHNHTVEDKKHGEYHIAQIAEFKIIYDTYNGCYSLEIGGVRLDLSVYLDKVVEKIDELYIMPSTKFGQFEYGAFLDYLYLSNKNFKETIDEFYKTI